MDIGATGPQVSVIIPTFNSAAYVAGAIASALASVRCAVEVIVIDDGSKDGTWQVLESFGTRIRAVRQDHGGPYRARNLGAQLARGPWLAFLDADDEWLPEKLSEQIAIAGDDVDLVYTDRLNFGDIRHVKPRQSDSVVLWEGDVFEPLLLGNFITLSSVLLRRRRFEELGGFEIQRQGVQDWDLWLRYSAAGGRVRVCRNPLTKYRIHAEQMSHDLDQRATDREAVLRRAVSLPMRREIPTNVVRRAYANIWEVGATQAATQDRAKAIRWYLRSVAHWPWAPKIYKQIVKSCLAGMYIEK